MLFCPLLLDSPRLMIRPLETEDVDAVCEIMDRSFGVAPRAERIEWLEWTVRNYQALGRLYQPPFGERAVIHKDTGALIGLVGIVPSFAPFEQLPSFRQRLQVPPSTHSTPEIGLFWATHPDYRRQGYASEAASAVVTFLCTQLGVSRVVATTEFDNTASIDVMKRIGMTVERNPHPTPSWFQIAGVLWNNA